MAILGDMLASLFGKRATQLESLLTGNPDTTIRAASDPLNTRTGYALSLDRKTHIVAGKIGDSVAYANCYKVQLDGGNGIRIAVKLCDSGTGASGARDTTTLSPGTRVWVLLPPQSIWGIILGVEPDLGLDAQAGLSDLIHQASRSGLHVDSYQSFPLQMSEGAGVFNWSAGRPFDGTTGNEWGRITETGLGFHLDPFLIKMAVNENCGVFATYWDSLLRISAYTYQLRLAAQSVEACNDQGEYRYVSGSTPYPWEHWGAFQRTAKVFQEFSEKEAQVEKAHYSYLEPLHDDQQPFHRLMDFGGYLGQGALRILAAPPSGATDVNRLSGSEHAIGLFREQLSLTGQYSVQSAKGITFLKRARIAVPRIKKDPQDPQGDTAENYRFAGSDGRGAEHVVRDGLQISGSLRHLVRAAAVMDAHAYTFNWEGAHPFHYHTQDWSLPEDAQSLPTSQNVSVGGASAIPNFSELASAQYLPAPGAITAKIDHRYGDAEYFLGESIFDMTDDGGLVIGDAYGFEIRSVGGEGHISCPSNLWLKPGKNLNVLAGYDLCMRAQNSFDISASKRDGRLKAERNLHVLAGNSGDGGLLLESRSEGTLFDFQNKVGEDVISSGIVLRSPKSLVAAWGRDVYLRTGPGDDGDVEKFDAGDIFIDANKGQRNVIFSAYMMLEYLDYGLYQHFGTNGEIKKSNEFTADYTALCSSIGINGTASINGSIYNKGWIYVSEGHIATQQSAGYDYRVPTIDGKASAQIQKSTQEPKTRTEKLLPKGYGKPYFNKNIKTRWYEDGMPGNGLVMSSAEFSFRTSQQYQVMSLVLFEDRWQQMARLGQISVGRWTEPPVVAAETTYPYPGLDWWRNQAAYHQQDLALYNGANGTYKGRNAAPYENPQPGATSTQILDGVYPVVLQA